MISLPPIHHQSPPLSLKKEEGNVFFLRYMTHNRKSCLSVVAGPCERSQTRSRPEKWKPESAACPTIFWWDKNHTNTQNSGNSNRNMMKAISIARQSVSLLLLASHLF